MSTNKPKPNPLFEYNYLINASTDSNAISIVNNYKKIYDNYVDFFNVSNTSADTTVLDNAATQILKNFDNIVNIIMPCITDPTSYTIKCTTNNACVWASDVEQISLQFVILIASMTSVGDLKSQYEFISFYMIRKLYDPITESSGNYSQINSSITPTYYLCANIPYRPRSDDPKLKAQFDKLSKKMETLQKNKDVRESDRTLINFLLYILLPTVIFILLIVAYVKYSKNNAAAASKAAAASNVAATDVEPPKVGGALYDALNFIGTISSKLMRI